MVINYLWAGMICLGILTAALSGKIEQITPTIFISAEQGVSVALGLISIMSFWLGVMRLAEKSGFIEIVKNFLTPLAYLLFPKLSRGHPAMSAILMNMSANLLGLGNSATPFGIKAMEELQSINPQPNTASDEMCTLLALNTSGLTLIPTTVIALRYSAGSLNPADIVGTTIIATLCSTLVAVTLDRLFRKMKR